MKAYILKEEDFEDLIHRLAVDPRLGADGGSSTTLSKEEGRIYDDSHRFYNYIIRRWIDKVKSEQ